jgi:hypothetical protein
MEGLQKLIRKVSKETKLGSSSSSPLSETPYLSGGRGGGGGVSAALSSSSDQSHVLVARAPRYFHYTPSLSLSLSLSLFDLLCIMYEVLPVIQNGFFGINTNEFLSIFQSLNTEVRCTCLLA